MEFVFFLSSVFTQLKEIITTRKLGLGGWLFIIGILLAVIPLIVGYVTLKFKLNSEILLMTLVYGIFIVPTGLFLMLTGSILYFISKIRK